MRLAILDLETTGVSPEKDHIVEIAIVRTEGGVETGRFSSLVRAPVSVGPSQRVHGIDDATLASAPTLSSLRVAVRAQLEGATLVAHRAPFDLAFLAAATARGELDVAVSDAIDTAVVSDRALGESGLRAIARRIAGRAPQHRALPDALAALDALAACVETLGPVDAQELLALSRPAASMRSAVETLLRAHPAVSLVYRPANGRAHEDVLHVERVEPPYVVGWLEKKNVRRMLRGDRIVRAWIGERPTLRFF